jgi:hypothetical protein
MGTRQATPEDRDYRSLDEVPFGNAGRVRLLRDYGLVLSVRIEAPEGVAEY